MRLPLHTLKVGSYGTHNTLGLAKWKRARFLLASTSEVYGDPLVHPQPETYWGNVNPIGPRGVYDEAKRYAEALTMAYHRQQGVDTCDRADLQLDPRRRAGALRRRARAASRERRGARGAARDRAVAARLRTVGRRLTLLDRIGRREYPLDGVPVPAFTRGRPDGRPRRPPR